MIDLEMIVSVEEMKTHMRSDDLSYDPALEKQEDLKIESLIKQVQAQAEDFCRVEFTYESAPEPVRLAIMLMVSHYYEFRDNYDKQTYIAADMAFKALLTPYRDPSKLF